MQSMPWACGRRVRIDIHFHCTRQDFVVHSMIAVGRDASDEIQSLLKGHSDGFPASTTFIRSILSLLTHFFPYTSHCNRRPLLKPCKCSGSMGMVHQECLISWLEVTRGDGECYSRF